MFPANPNLVYVVLPSRSGVWLRIILNKEGIGTLLRIISRHSTKTRITKSLLLASRPNDHCIEGTRIPLALPRIL